MSENRNFIIEGKKKGEAILLRGDYVRMKIWSALVAAPHPVQTLDLLAQTNCSYDQVKSWLDAWSLHGFVTKEALDKSPTGGQRFVFTAIDKTELPPGIDLKGRDKPVEHRQYIWEAIRDISNEHTYFKTACMLEHIFEKHSIHVSRVYATSYLRSLCHACYLTSEYDDYDRELIYSLNYNTGPFAPSVRRGKAIFDPNLGVMVS